MSYTKLELFNDINALVERYITQELAAHMPAELDADVTVEPDEQGDHIDLATGDIWDLEKQEVIGVKDLKTGIKTWVRDALAETLLPVLVKEAETPETVLPESVLVKAAETSVAKEEVVPIPKKRTSKGPKAPAKEAAKEPKAPAKQTKAPAKKPKTAE